MEKKGSRHEFIKLYKEMKKEKDKNKKTDQFKKIKIMKIKNEN